jgi:hypothetical protein
MLEGSHFYSCEDIMQKAMAQLHTNPKQAFRKCFKQWKDHWAKCVESQGTYFEGD